MAYQPASSDVFVFSAAEDTKVHPGEQETEEVKVLLCGHSLTQLPTYDLHHRCIIRLLAPIVRSIVRLVFPLCPYLVTT